MFAETISASPCCKVAKRRHGSEWTSGERSEPWRDRAAARKVSRRDDETEGINANDKRLKQKLVSYQSLSQLRWQLPLHKGAEKFDQIL